MAFEFASVLAKSSTPPHSCSSMIPSRTQQIVPSARNAFTRTFLQVKWFLYYWHRSFNKILNLIYLYIYSIVYLSSASRHIWSRPRTPPCLAISLQRWLPSKARFISWSMDNFKTLFDFLSLRRSTLNYEGKIKNMAQVYKPWIFWVELWLPIIKFEMECTLISLLSISSMSFVNVAPSCVTISTIADSLPTILPGAIELLATVVETVRYIMCLLTLNFNLKIKYALKALFYIVCLCWFMKEDINISYLSQLWSSSRCWCNTSSFGKVLLDWLLFHGVDSGDEISPLGESIPTTLILGFDLTSSL